MKPGQPCHSEATGRRIRAPWGDGCFASLSITCLLPLALLAAACAPIASSPGEGQADAQKPAARKRITAAIQSNPPGITANFIVAGSGTVPGGDALEELMNGGLTHTDGRGVRRGQLAEDPPTVENGLWKVLPDGRMETTWKIRGNALWHDGTPFTSADILFDALLEQDKELPIFSSASWDFVEGINATDARTVVVRWKQPYIRADIMFTKVRPKHILEKPYLEDKLSVLQHPYWTDQFVGPGPFKLKQWVQGSHLVAEAFDGYVFGRPKVDEIVVKFIPDTNTMAANVLAGEVELTLGRNISIQQAKQLEQVWREGRIDVGFTNWIALYPQFINSTPAVLTNVQFRRALLHSINRQELIDTLQHGMGTIPHTFLNPREPMYNDIERHIVRYDYDPRQSGQLLETLGYARGADGLFRDAGGQVLSLEVRTSGGDDAHEYGILAIADFFKRAGVEGQPYTIPQAQREDRGANVSYPGVRLWRLPNDPWDLTRYHGSKAGTPENNFRETSNRARYMNPELDRLIDTYMVTISAGDRIPLLGELVRHQTENITAMGLWYNTNSIVVGNRLRNVANAEASGANMAWNAHLWDVV